MTILKKIEAAKQKAKTTRPCQQYRANENNIWFANLLYICLVAQRRLLMSWLSCNVGWRRSIKRNENGWTSAMPSASLSKAAFKRYGGGTA